MKSFEARIKDIFYYIAEYGIDHKQLDLSEPRAISEADRKEFITYVHKGFRIGQEKLVHELLILQKDAIKFKEASKEARVKKDKDAIAQTEQVLAIVEHRSFIIRHFADFIAWQIFKGHYYQARSFYSGKRERPSLLNCNLDSVLRAAEHFHKESETAFALITDLTSFIDIGDLLVADNKSMKVVEVKSGNVQREVFNFIEELDTNRLRPEDYYNKDEKFFKQAERTIKQQLKAVKTVQFLNTEKGKDAFTEVERHVFETTAIQHRYYEQIIDLLKNTKGNFGYKSIDDILIIAFYKGDMIGMAGELIENVSNFAFKERYLWQDYIGQIYMPLKEPLFFKPFAKEIIFDLLLGRLKIMISLNLNRLIELFTSKGLKAKWLSKKEPQKQIEKSDKRSRPFVCERQAIQIETPNAKLVLGDTFIIKLLFDNLTPDALVNTYLEMKISEATED
jgi:hypothetical protein